MKTIRRRVPARTIVSYQCTKCGAKYPKPGPASLCESMPIENKRFKVGDKVTWREKKQCGRIGAPEIGYFLEGTVININGPMVADMEYNLKWLQGALSGVHCFEYEVTWICPHCDKKQSSLFYAPELKRIR